MEKFNKKQLIPGILFLLICFILFISSIIRTESRSKELIQEYPSMNRDDSINNVVLEKFQPDGFKYSPTTVLVTLDNGHKYRIHASLKSDTGLNDVLHIKCLIMKKSGNDTLRVKYNDGNLGYFILKK